MGKKWKRRLLYAAIAAHLALVGYHAAEQKLVVTNVPKGLLLLYGNLTGATSSFAFFAPRVTADLRLRYELTLADGQVISREDFFHSVSREASLRKANIVGNIWLVAHDTELKRSIAASLAAKILSDNPTAKKITLFFEAFHLPTMKQYKSGEEVTWETLYRTEFTPEAV